MQGKKYLDEARAAEREGDKRRRDDMYKASARSFLRGAEQEDHKCMSFYAWLARRGHGFSGPEPKLARKWYTRALRVAPTEKGRVRIMRKLRDIAWQDLNLHEEGKNWNDQCIKLNDAWSLYDAGRYALHDRNGFKKSEAEGWFRKVMELDADGDKEVREAQEAAAKRIRRNKW